MIDITTLQTKLEAERQKIVADLSVIAVQEPETGDWLVHPTTDTPETDENAEADAFEETAQRQATLAELETIYHNINRALKKIEMGTFGSCEICHAPIEDDRLSFLPTSRTCKEHRDEERTLAL